MTRSDQHSLQGLTERIRAAGAAERVSVGDIVDAVGQRSLVPLVLAPALLAATPLSGIPGLSSLCGLLIALVSFQLLLGFDRIRLPGVLLRQSVEAAALRSTLDRAGPAIAWVDRHSRPRLTGLFFGPLAWLPKLLCLISGLAMPFLEITPFSASAVAIGVCFLAFSLLTCDGLFFLLALVPYGALAALVGTQIT